MWGRLPGECEKPFFLYPSHLGSSRFPREEPGRPPKGPWRRIRVPTISLVELCSEARFPDGIDLLKIDIEGSEADLLRHDAAVLPRVRAAVVEIHRWLAAPGCGLPDGEGRSQGSLPEPAGKHRNLVFFPAMEDHQRARRQARRPGSDSAAPVSFRRGRGTTPPYLRGVQADRSDVDQT